MLVKEKKVEVNMVSIPSVKRQILHHEAFLLSSDRYCTTMAGLDVRYAVTTHRTAFLSRDSTPHYRLPQQRQSDFQRVDEARTGFGQPPKDSSDPLGSATRPCEDLSISAR
eukprot:1487935-Rhodomonas_salina.1